MLTRPRFTGIDPAARAIWLERIRRAVNTSWPNACVYFAIALSVANGWTTFAIILAAFAFVATAVDGILSMIQKAEASAATRDAAVRDALLEAAAALRATAELMRTTVDQYRRTNSSP